MIYSTRKAFLERAIVELVYKFNEKSTATRAGSVLAVPHFKIARQGPSRFWNDTIIEERRHVTGIGANVSNHIKGDKPL